MTVTTEEHDDQAEPENMSQTCEVSPMHKDELDIAHRRLCREVAASFLVAMAETDMGFAEIAAKLGTSEPALRRWFYRLMDGRTPLLRAVSDLATAMGRRVLIRTESTHYE